MKALIEWCLLLIILTNIFLLSSGRLVSLIRSLAGQGVVIGILPLLLHTGHLPLRIVTISLAAIILKGIIFPTFLYRSIHQDPQKYELSPYLDYISSVIIGLIVMSVASYFLSKSFPQNQITNMALAASIFTFCSGLILIVARKKAISQVVGFLILENGTYLLSIILVSDIPFMVEIGLLLDAFVSVLLMSFAIEAMEKEFHHMDVSEFQSLKG